MTHAPAAPPGRSRRAGRALLRVVSHVVLALALFLLANLLADLSGLLAPHVPDFDGDPLTSILSLVMGLLMVLFMPMIGLGLLGLWGALILLHTVWLGTRGLFASLTIGLLALEAAGYLFVTTWAAATP